MNDNIVQLILNKLAEEAEQESHRVYTKGVYRASEIGGCARALQYNHMGFKGETLTPETHMIFRDGHMHHDALRELLAKVGTLSHIETNVSKKYNHKGTKFLLTGTCDGVFNGIIIDIKSINTFRFMHLDKNFPSDYMNYVIQLNIYMDILNIHKGVLLFKDKNSGEIAPRHLTYNAELMEQTLERVASLHNSLKTGEMLKRPYVSSDWHCKLCQHRKECWHLPMEGKHWGAAAYTNPHQKAKDADQRTLAAKLKASLRPTT